MFGRIKGGQLHDRTLGRPDSEADLRLLWRIIGPYRRRACVVLAFALLNTVLATLGIGMVFPVFQALLDPQHESALLVKLMPALTQLTPDLRITALAAGTILLFAVKEAVSLASAYLKHDLVQELRLYWVMRIGERYLTSRYLWLARRKQGELLNGWFNESLVSANCFQAYLVYLSSTFLVIMLVVLGIIVNWPIMLAMVAGGGAVMLVARSFLYARSARFSNEKLGLNQSMSSAMLENLANVRDIKLMRAEPRRLQQLEKIARRSKRVTVVAFVMGEFPRSLGEFLAVLVIMIIIVGGLVGLRLTAQDMLPLLVFFFLTFHRLVTSSSEAMSARVKGLTTLHSVMLMDRLLNGQVDLEDREAGRPVAGLESDISFVNLSFSYHGGKRVLHDITATIPKCKTTVLVGPSGAGKSTLLDLLLRLEPPSTGRIEANGRDVAEFNLIEWRRHFGYVSQDPTLFNGSLRMNLQLAKPNASDAVIEQACELAGATEFIARLPGGYDTTVGDRGYSLSGGQRKRIAIARALISAPAVLILDEATTSFEHSLEQEILANIKRMMPLLTVIQVTHRLQGARNADWVIALKDGQVRFTGPWPEASAGLDFVDELTESDA